MSDHAHSGHTRVLSDHSHSGHTRVLSEAGSLKSLDEEWASVLKLQKLSGAELTNEPEVCSICREGATAKRKVVACRVCKMGLCNACLAPKQELCANCSVFVQGTHVVYKEGVLTTEILGKVFTTSYVRFVGSSVLVYAVQPDPIAPAGTYDLWTAVSLYPSKYVFVMPALAEKEEQAGLDCPEPGAMFYLSLQTGKEKKTHYFIADSSQAAAMWTSAITRVLEASRQGVKLQDARDEIVVEGYLKCLAGFPKSWKTFYFHLLKGGHLVFFKEHPCSPTKCLRMLSLKNATCKSNAFRIIVVGDGINCACFRPHSAELEQWIPAIALAVEKAQVDVLKKTWTQDQLFGLVPIDSTNADGLFAIGDIVETFGLSSTAHNGLRGKVVTCSDNGRYEIMLPSSEVIRFRGSNLRYPDQGDSSDFKTSSKSPVHASGPPAPFAFGDDFATPRHRAFADARTPLSPSKHPPPPPPDSTENDSVRGPSLNAGKPPPPNSAENDSVRGFESPKASPRTPKGEKFGKFQRHSPGDDSSGSFKGIESPKSISKVSLGEKTGKLQKRSDPEVVEEFLKQLSGAGKFAPVVGVAPPPVVTTPIIPPIDPDQVLEALSTAETDAVSGWDDDLSPRIERLEARNAELEKEIAFLQNQLASVPETQKQIAELRAVMVAYTASRPLASAFFPKPPGLPFGAHMISPPTSPPPA